MKRLAVTLLLISFAWSLTGYADDVIPSVSKEEMSAYKSAFGKAISDSRRAEGNKPAAAGDAGQMAEAAKNDSFGAKVSDAARNLKSDILKDNKNFGAWVSKQRSQRPDDAGSASASKGGSDAASAKASTAAGRPKGKSDEKKKKSGN